MKMINTIKKHYTYTLFRTKRIPAGYEVTINGKKYDPNDQRFATVIWTTIAVSTLFAAISLLLPAVVYAFTSFGLHVTIGTEAYDHMAGCIYDICRALKDLTINYTWVGGFLNTIHAYKFVQLLIVAVCGYGVAKAAVFFHFACVQWKRHFSNEAVPTATPVPFDANHRGYNYHGRTDRNAG